ncbi:MAG: hypothetical protein E7586_05790 [Ruminococcaceae bacterium]|nr:hypothetical protein [Oscillospiraceae bacterium]
MKKMLRLTALLLLIAMLFSLVACGENKNNGDIGKKSDTAGEGDVVMSYEGFGLTKDEFNCIATFIKDTEIYNRQYQLYQQTGKVYSEADILAMQVDENSTYADLLEKYTVEYAQRLLIVEKLCNDAELSISDESDVETIENYISDVEYAYGGEDLFDIALVKMGFTRDAIRRYQRLSFMFDMLYESRYGENGTAPISKESIENYFTENYFYFDGAVYSYVDSTNGTKVMFDYSDEDIADYFNKNFVKVRHILYKTVDSAMKPVSAEVKADKKQKAEKALNSITSGEKTFEDLLSENEDVQSEYVFTKGEMVKEFETESFSMVYNEVRIVETEYGFHIIEKLPLKESDLKGTVGTDGKTTGDRRETVKKAMSVAQIRNEALETLEKLKNGELESYPAKDDKKSYYMVVEPAFIDKNDTSYAALVELLKKAEYNVYNEKDYASSGTQIYRKIKFEKEKITSEVYSTIEEKLAVEALVDYIVEYYDSVEMDNGFFEGFDISTLPLLEKEFYTEN